MRYTFIAFGEEKKNASSFLVKSLMANSKTDAKWKDLEQLHIEVRERRIKEWSGPVN